LSIKQKRNRKDNVQSNLHV